jgi:hypothetical protein
LPGSHPAFSGVIRIEDVDTRNDALADVLRKLPTKNYRLLDSLVRHLRRVAAEEQANRMTIENLALVFGPTLARSPRGLEGDLRDNGVHIMIAKALLTLPPAIWSATSNVKRSSVRTKDTQVSMRLQSSRRSTRHSTASTEQKAAIMARQDSISPHPAGPVRDASHLRAGKQAKPPVIKAKPSAPTSPKETEDRDRPRPLVSPRPMPVGVAGMQLPAHLMARMASDPELLDDAHQPRKLSLVRSLQLWSSFQRLCNYLLVPF